MLRVPAYVDNVAYNDDKEEFLRLVNAKRWTKEKLLHKILPFLISREAVDCIEALFELEPGLTVDDVNAPFQKIYGWPPLHYYAYYKRPKKIDFLLRKGASADLRVTNLKASANPYYNYAPYDKMLPINVALHDICQLPLVKSWTTKQSAFNLILRLLCNCNGKRVPSLECVKLLASETQGVDDEIYHYCLEGKVIELAALMLADHGLVLSFFQRIYCSNPASGGRTPRQQLTAEIAWLSANEIRLKHSDKYQLHRDCKEKLQVRMHTLQLLEIFEHAGNQIAAYLKFEEGEHIPEQVSEEVPWILKQAGFTLKHGDLDLSPMDESDVLRVYIDSPNLGFLEFDVSNYVTQGILRPIHPKGNGKLQESASTHCKPYKQWRFASTCHKYGPESFFVQNYDASPSSEGILLMCHESNPMSQLIVAIDKLCSHRYLKDWSSKLPIFKLLYILFVPELIGELKHTREHSCEGLDAGKIGPLACYYVKEGKLAELAALLVIAHKKLISQTGPQTDEITKIHNCILIELQILVNEEVGLMRSCLSLSRTSAKRKRMVLLSALLLLEIFERAGHILEKYVVERYSSRDLYYRRVVSDVAFLLEKSGFVLRDKDIFVQDLSCFRHKIQPEEAENLNSFISAETGTSVHSQPHLKKTWEAHRPVDARLMHPRLAPHLWGVYNRINEVQSFHTFRIISERGSNLTYSLPMSTQANRAGIIKSDLPSSKISLGNKWVSFVSTIIKGIKQV